METVVVGVDAVVDAQPVHPDETALDHADGVERAGDQVQVADPQIAAAVEQEMVGTVRAAASGGRRDSAARTAELKTLAVDSPGAFDGHVLGIHGEDQTDVSVDESRVAV